MVNKITRKEIVGLEDTKHCSKKFKEMAGPEGTQQKFRERKSHSFNTLNLIRKEIAGLEDPTSCGGIGGFFLACEDFGRMFDHSFSRFFRSRTLIPLFRPGSVDSGSAS